MDILIKNMEMPRGNNVLVVDSAGTITKVNRWTGKVEATDSFHVKAVALPSHGRLGDLDAIRESLSSDCPCRGCERFHEEGVCMNCQWDRFAKLIDEAETIVEATNE